MKYPSSIYETDVKEKEQIAKLGKGKTTLEIEELVRRPEIAEDDALNSFGSD